LSERVFEHGLCTTEVAPVAERVAQVRREANLIRSVFRMFLHHSVETVVEEVDSALRLAERGITLTERRIDIGTLRRAEELGLNCGLESLDRGGVVPRPRLGESERDTGAECRGRVAGGYRVIVDPLDGVESVAGIVGQAQLELRIGKPELSLVDLAEIGPRLEVFDRDAELWSELPEGLDGGAPRLRLDPRDVGIGDARRRELALRKLAFKA
jgi:hypothetical protein